jgi:hypothetical protein
MTKIIILAFGTVLIGLVALQIFTSRVSHDEVTIDIPLSKCQLYYRDVFFNAKEYATFEDYPVTTTYTGPVATLDEESHAVAKRFYSYHVVALDKGVTFAGKYTISDWAYTGVGQMFAVIDVETGDVYPFPYLVDWEFDFRPNSNLIVINPKDSVPAFDKLDGTADVSCDVKWFDDMKTYYFVFEDNEFKLIGPEDVSGLITAEWLSDEPMVP